MLEVQISINEFDQKDIALINLTNMTKLLLMN
jgi:hypothetical protein